ncbi:hypothetical protein KLMA_50359 [Kluyveromyces marxianus]|nr:hypothetical protein KLMA_50359 [Kluyveromyces marxianus]
MAIVQMFENGGTKTTTASASSLYQFLKSFELLSVRQQVGIKKSNIHIDQKLVKGLTEKVPRYAAATLSQSYKKRAPTMDHSQNKSQYLNNLKCSTTHLFRANSTVRTKGSKLPDFYSVFKPPSGSENGTYLNMDAEDSIKSDCMVSMRKIFQKEPRSATCEFTSKYVTAEFSQRYKSTEPLLVQEYNKALLEDMVSLGVSKPHIKKILKTLARNEQTIQELENECLVYKQSKEKLESALVSIQSLCSLQYASMV